MKKMIKTIGAPVLAASLLAVGTVGCGDTVEDLLISINDRQGGNIEGDITADETWVAGEDYVLSGKVTVKDGVTLTIEPGAVIKATKDPIGWLQVERGAKIMAEGTDAQPIVFTSNQPVGSRQAGDWGGVVILGKATNNTGTDVELEGNGGVHGGTDDTDSSGVLKYVRIEYAGWELSPDNELNGLTLGSVGSGTVLDYVQVHQGLDDGIEWFGGTANGSHLVVSAVGDDCFDTDEGYRGVIQWAVCVQEPGRGDNGIEASNTGGDNLDVTPLATPQFANFTFVGRGDFDKGNGIRAKDHTSGSAANGVIVAFASAIDVDHAVSQTNSDGAGGVFGVSNTIMFANKTAAAASAADNVSNDEDEFDEVKLAEGSSNKFEDPQLGDLNHQAPDLKPAAGSPALSCAAPAAPFDTSAAYCGAVGTDDWLAGWTSFVDVAPKEVVKVSDKISADTTWTADKIYVLTTLVSVEADATLTIEAGTQILGETGSFLRVQRDGAINAVGTADEPIVFTSAKTGSQRQAGDWGGVVLLGNAKNNNGIADSELEGNGGQYGGDDDADSSGTLKYVRIEYAGNEVSPDNELNGLTLGSVGSGTVISYVQVHRGLDDGIEWFGGAADADHVIVSATGDDCFDTDEGYRGIIQFAVCIQQPGIGDNGVEASNTGGDNLSVTPLALPNFANFTFIGRADYEKGNGIRAKDGTQINATNGLIWGFKSGFDLDNQVEAGAPGVVTDTLTVVLSNTVFAANTDADADANAAGNIDNDSDDKKDDNDNVIEARAFDETAFISNSANIQFVAADGALVVDPTYDAPSLLLAADSDALDCDAPAAPFDTSGDYCGAFDDTNDWMAGWANFGQ